MSGVIGGFYVWWFKGELRLGVWMVCWVMVVGDDEKMEGVWGGEERKMWRKLKRKGEKDGE